MSGDERRHHGDLAPRQVPHLARRPRRARGGRPAGRPTADRARPAPPRRWRPPPTTGAMRNVPARTRNSPTKPLSPGSPMAASMATVNTAAMIGRGPLQPPQLVDLPGLATLVDPADHDEQHGDDEPVVDHLQHAAGDPLGGEREGPEHDEPEVAERGVRHQPLHVARDTGHDGAVEDPDHAQGEQQRGQVDHGPGEQVEVEADDAVGAHLGHDRGQDDRPPGGRLGVGVGRPRVEGEDRCLHGEGGGEGQEQQHLRRQTRDGWR